MVRLDKVSLGTCSLVCDQVARLLEETERVCKATGDTWHWANAVALSDALSEFYRSDKRLFRAAMDAGVTKAQWAAIKRGED